MEGANVCWRPNLCTIPNDLLPQVSSYLQELLTIWSISFPLQLPLQCSWYSLHQFVIAPVHRLPVTSACLSLFILSPVLSSVLPIFPLTYWSPLSWVACPLRACGFNCIWKKMLIETKLGLAFVWQSQFFPGGVCGQLQKFWFRILFCFTAEDSIYFLTTRFIHTRDCTSHAEILGLKSDSTIPWPFQIPRVSWPGPLPKEKSLYRNSFTRSNVLCSLPQLQVAVTPMPLKWIQSRRIVKIFRWSCGILRLSFVVPANTLREASQNRDG